jgi:hypothetical protein
MPEFHTLVPRSLKRQGLTGRVAVAFDGEALQLTGASGAGLAIRPEAVARLRAGVERPRGGPIFTTRLWLQGEAKPVRFIAFRPDLNDYAAMIGGFAAGLEAEKLETGLTVATRRWAIGLLTLPLAFAMTAWALALHDKPLWQGLLVAAVPMVALAVAVVATRTWVPRPAGSHAAFTAALRDGS